MLLKYEKERFSHIISLGAGAFFTIIVLNYCDNYLSLKERGELFKTEQRDFTTVLMNDV